MNYVYALLVWWSFQCAAGTLPAAVAGSWYPALPSELRGELTRLYEEAARCCNAPFTAQKIRALVVPHAGYQHSGVVAAAAYRLVDAAPISTVILLAPSHTHEVTGIIYPSADRYHGPYGTLRIDRKRIRLLKSPLFVQYDAPFVREHSLEAQLPFIAKISSRIRVVPLLVGSLSPEQYQEASSMLRTIIDDTTLVIVSTDMTHYGAAFQYVPFTDTIRDRIRLLDSRLLDAVQQQDASRFEKLLQETGDTVCGARPLSLLLHMIQSGIWGSVMTRLVAYRQSEGADDRIVSYAALAVTEQPIGTLLTEYERRALVSYAREIIRSSFDQQSNNALLVPVLTPRLQQPQAVFVTIYDSLQQLRGCIGVTVAEKPLYQNVKEMALAAAFRDPRFSPLTEQELPHVRIEVSLLEEPHAIASPDEIRLNRDGIILTQGSASALFLPKVPQEFGWTKEETLRQLSKKAGLPEDAWRDEKTTFKVFTTTDIIETRDS